MRNEEITESLQNGTIESLQEDLEYANRIINSTHPRFGPSPERRADWAEYRDLVLAEIAARG